MKVNSCLASSPNLSEPHEMNSDEIKATMKESDKRYTNPFLSDQENDKLNLWNNKEDEDSINEDNFTSNLEDENFKKAKEVYIDKKVTEFMACYEESDFHVVKDICVDNGLSQDEKIEIDKKDHELSCKHNTDTDTETVTVNGDKHDDTSEDCYKNTDLCSVTKDELDTDFLIQKHSNEDMIEGNFDKDISSQNSSQGKDDIKECGNKEEVENVSKDENDLKSFVESNIIQTTENCIHEVLSDTQSSLNNNMASANIMTANQLHRGGGGETSFSLAGPVSGRITYCGSISHRSDSSNTSVRSFAFPILQTEWNSSPVRMVKVEQRGLRKHRGWRQALMCCKF
ncbi:uncharacterized protein LOC111896511 [Lactuca sativa]|uniref:Uncharacterized protein n=1 Tax=Lactuca sativa TaxID=4236 RepID=A0A9R1XMK9_LACSA|nr:uncharacterized protein LOC111896511 [Lactuca sativa]KAJ0212987.1 hypothetical protein LSAT_V11C400165230 [Lactuca sativa]